VQRREVLEQDLVLGRLGRLGVDLVDLDQREVALAVLRRADLALDRVAGVQVEAPDLRGGNVDVVGAREVGGLGRAQEAEAVGSTSSVPSPKIETPFFAWLFSSAKMRSCLRIRLAFSMPLDTAMSTSCETWCAFSSERCIGIATGLAAGVPAFCAGVESWGCCERTASGWAACDLLMLGTYVRTAAPEPWRWTTLLDSPPSGMEGALT